MPTNAKRGIAIVVNDRTPSKAETMKLPIIVNGISNNVKAPARITNAFTFSVAF